MAISADGKTLVVTGESPTVETTKAPSLLFLNTHLEINKKLSPPPWP
jgi:hypothetical protein